MILATNAIKRPTEINFKEFLIVLSTIMRGSLDEKIQWLFYLYDINKDGKITHDVNFKLQFFYSLLKWNLNLNKTNNFKRRFRA